MCDLSPALPVAQAFSYGSTTNMTGMGVFAFGQVLRPTQSAAVAVKSHQCLLGLYTRFEAFSPHQGAPSLNAFTDGVHAHPTSTPQKIFQVQQPRFLILEQYWVTWNSAGGDAETMEHPPTSDSCDYK